MASIKRLKKDIDYLTFAVIADSVHYNMLNDGNSEAVSEIIAHIVNTRNHLRSKLNSEKKFDSRKESKAFYKGIMNEILSATDDSFTKLSGIIKE